jgi:nitrate reductase cytochrome c-type subunit
VGHTECTACHDIHEAKVRADRATCMTCHEDIANHEPDAKRCTGCHTFIRSR